MNFWLKEATYMTDNKKQQIKTNNNNAKQLLEDFCYILDREYECYLKQNALNVDNCIYVKRFIEFVRNDINTQIAKQQKLMKNRKL